MSNFHVVSKADEDFAATRMAILADGNTVYIDTATSFLHVALTRAKT
jgi:hypothetical protein